MPDKPAPTPSPLVARIYQIEAAIAALASQRDAVAAELIALGAGEYSDEEARHAIVVVPTEESISYALGTKPAWQAFLKAKDVKKGNAKLKVEFTAAQLSEARDLAGDAFGKLFDMVITYGPAKGFEDLVPKILTTAGGRMSAKGRDLLALCKIVKPPSAAYVKLPDKPAAEESPEDE
jgi:hypothetical protein